MSETKPETEVLALFSEFHTPSHEDWTAAAVQSLKGKSLDKLKSNTYEGIQLEPVYGAEAVAGLPHLSSFPGQFPFVRGTHLTGQKPPWLITQELAYSTPSALNAALKHDLAQGQTAVFLTFDPPTLQGLDPAQSTAGLVGRGGLSLCSTADMAQLWDGIALAHVPLFMQPEKVFLPLTALLIAHLQQAGIDPAVLSGCVGADPLGSLVRRGMSQPIAKSYDQLAELIRWTTKNAPNFQAIGIFADTYHNMGAHAVQELAFGMATAVSTLRALQKRGISVDDAANNMRFIFGIGGDFFIEVAKLRAARMVWAQIVTAFGGSETAQKMRMHTRTSRFNKTVTDPYVNMLRVTTEAFAGAVGGTDSQHVGPFDEAARRPDEFARRIARNVQVILQEEANLTRLVDPAGGAYVVEYLTDQVAQRAWALFQKIEAQGGMLAALEAGLPQEWVTETAVARATNLATRTHILVGTNLYANPDEEKLTPAAIDYDAIYAERLSRGEQTTVDNQPLTTNRSDFISLIAAAERGATLGKLWGIQPEPGIPAHTIPPFPRQRAARPFEKLRDVSDDYLAAHGHRPQIILANIGPTANHKPRADFTTRFFKVGGFEIVPTSGFDTVDDAVQAVVASGITAVAICGTDADYSSFVSPFVQQLKAQQPGTTVILAGCPKDHIETFQAAGVDLFIHVKADCLKTNQIVQAKYSNMQQAKTEPDQHKNKPAESNLILDDDINSIFG